MKRKSWHSTFAIKQFAALFLLLLPASLLAEPLPLKRAVELALSHGTTMAIAQADQDHALASYHELRNNFIPQLIAGSGIGWSDGFPLSLEGSAPSLFNVTAQSALLNPALKDFLHAARAEYTVSTLNGKNQRAQTIQDTVLTYAELAKWEQRLARLQETQSAAEKMEAAVAQRVKEGIDSEIEDTKARLSVARIRLRITEASGSADVLREHLSKLTGLAANSIETVSDSMPVLPVVRPEDDMAAKALESNPNVQAAVEHARAQYLKAKAERKSLWPSVDFAAQYANLATYNNYDKFYRPGSFQPNNATVGVAIHLPFLNLAQHSRAQEAKSEAFKSQKQTEATRNQISEETLRLQRSVTQMQAAHDVATLEYEIAEKNIDAVQTRMDAGSATLHDLDDARSQASERYIALQDVTFELERSQVGLLRTTGELERWVLGTP